MVGKAWFSLTNKKRRIYDYQNFLDTRKNIVAFKDERQTNKAMPFYPFTLFKRQTR